MFRLRLIRCLCCLVAVALPWAAHAGGNDGWRYDTVHSQIVFSISHNGYSRPFGRLHIASGWVRFDPNDWSTAATELDIDMASVDMGDADWNRAVCAPSLLDCARHPQAHFRSTGVERKDDHHGVLHGQLTLLGVTRPLDLPFTFNRAARTIFEVHKIAGFSATAALERSDFGITAHPGSIGRHVSIWLQLELIADDHAIPDTKESP